MNREIKQLIDLADEALSEDFASVRFLDAMEEYVQAFAAWQKKVGLGVAGGLEVQAQPDVDIEQLKLLDKKHSKLLTRAGQLHEQTAKDLKDQQERGKGIRAYVDTLPKRLSVKFKKRS